MNAIHRSLFVVVMLCFTSNKAQAQLYISDDFKILVTTEIHVAGDVFIAPTGTIENWGTIELMGDLTNQGNSLYTSGNPSIATTGSWIFAGVAVQNVNFGADTLANITINNVSGLQGANMVVGGTATFTTGKWLLAATDARLLSTALVTGTTSNSYFVTDGSGHLYIDYTVTGVKIFPIGTATVYAPLALNPQGTNKVGARVHANFYENPESQTNMVTENAVALTWDILNEATITSGALSLSYPATAELTNFTRADANIVSWKDGSSTSYLTQNAVTSGTNPYTTALDTTFQADAASTYYLGVTDDKMFNIFLNVTAFLEGAYIIGGSMTTDLSAGGNASILALNALTQPYGAAPWPVLRQYPGSETVSPTFFDVNTAVVDWILIELRDKTDNTLVVASRAGLLNSTGNILDTNGLTGLNFLAIAPDNYFISIRHRNHLGVMSANTVFLDADPVGNAIDFTTTATTLYGTNAAVEVEIGVTALHMGDANSNGNIRFIGLDNDKDRIGAFLNADVTPSNRIDGYQPEDIDLNGETRFIGLGNDKDKLGIKLQTTVTPTAIFFEQLP